MWQFENLKMPHNFQITKAFDEATPNTLQLIQKKTAILMAAFLYAIGLFTA